VVGDLAQIFPDKFGGPQDEAQNKSQAGVASFGMQIQNLTARQRETMGLKVAGGVQVVSVEPDSFAQDIGLRQGDVLLAINNHPVNSTDDMMKIKSSLKPGDAVALKIMRSAGRGGDWTSSFVAGTMPNNGQ
jgi:S1-C subfamily serine protease